MNVIRILGAVIIAVTSLGGSDAFGDASFQGLGGCSNYNRSYARGISADGSVVVGDIFSAWSGGHYAFRWTEAAGVAMLPDLPGGSSLFRSCHAYGVSEDGAVIVGNGTSSFSTTPNEACRWTSPTYSVQGLGYPPDSKAAAVSADGSVIVGINSDDGAFRWTEATGMVGLGGAGSRAADVSADGSVVVGTWNDEAFRWTEATGMVGLDYHPETYKSYANSVSADGMVVVGTCRPYSATDEAFRWTAATGMVGLGCLPETFTSQAVGVSGDGSVVVGNCYAGYGVEPQPFVWDAVSGMRSLRDILVNDCGLDLTGWVIYSASDISADGRRIVGLGTNPSGLYEAWLATIPDLTMPTLVSLDIKPGACPNPLNVRVPGRDVYTEDKNDYDLMGAKENPGQKDKPEGPKPVLTIAIAGTEELNVTDIDPTSLTLEGVPALRWSYEDVTTPLHEQAEECECSNTGADGIVDLTLKFDRAAIISTLGEVHDRDTIPLTITGEFYDGTPIEGTDCVVILGTIAPEAAPAGAPSDASIVGLANYPNPFNPATQISFTLPRAAEVKLEVFNIMGQKVTTLIDRQLNAGDHSRVWDGSGVASGVYFYRLETPDFAATKKMVLMK